MPLWGLLGGTGRGAGGAGDAWRGCSWREQFVLVPHSSHYQLRCLHSLWFIAWKAPCPPAAWRTLEEKNTFPRCGLGLSTGFDWTCLKVLLENVKRQTKRRLLLEDKEFKLSDNEQKLPTHSLVNPFLLTPSEIFAANVCYSLHSVFTFRHTMLTSNRDFMSLFSFLMTLLMGNLVFCSWSVYFSPLPAFSLSQFVIFFLPAWLGACIVSLLLANLITFQFAHVTVWWMAGLLWKRLNPAHPLGRTPLIMEVIW